MLKKFTIMKLFGTTDVELNLQTGVNIFVGENGIGKTTILNLLHAFFVVDIRKICEVKFEKVTFELSKHQHTFRSEDIIRIVSTFSESDRYYSRRRYSLDNTLKIIQKLSDDEIKKYSNRPPYFLKEYLSHKDPVFFERENISIYDIEMLRGMEDSLKIIRKLLSLQKDLELEILYFPTFRRIETDLKQFGFSEEDTQKIAKNKLLNFGMGDVTELLEGKLSAIKNSIRLGFSKMTTTLLKQYVSGKFSNFKKINITNLDAIFSILSDSLPTDLKEKIFDMVNDGTINGPANKLLLNYINCLVDIYEAQSKNLNEIEKFVETCNNYLFNKKLVFNKNTLNVTIVSSDDNREIKFSNLSSGEKQMTSIFSKLYLENNSQYLILFDEPELSLSIEWQKMLIPDIMNAQSCKQLLAVTHSPFIFDNDYDDNARSLQDCMKR